jgi:hypothetical protein
MERRQDEQMLSSFEKVETGKDASKSTLRLIEVICNSFCKPLDHCGSQPWSWPSVFLTYWCSHSLYSHPGLNLGWLTLEMDSQTLSSFQMSVTSTNIWLNFMIIFDPRQPNKTVCGFPNHRNWAIKISYYCLKPLNFVFVGYITLDTILHYLCILSWEIGTPWLACKYWQRHCVCERILIKTLNYNGINLLTYTVTLVFPLYPICCF